MIRAVVFDMDGVLIDAKEWHYEALNLALAGFGLSIGREEHLAHYDGLPTRTKLERLTRCAGLPRSAHDEVARLKQLHTVELVRARCAPRADHLALVTGLAALGYPTAVASNSVRESVDLMLGLAGLLPHLAFTLSSSDVVAPKPHPAVYLEAVRRLALRPQEVLVVEDNENGIAAARAAGTHVLVVRTVDDVNLPAVLSRIALLDGSGRSSRALPALPTQRPHGAARTSPSVPGPAVAAALPSERTPVRA
ncbi:HAD family hydrolase [Cellulomonas marina]|uniref:Haloacid dehalogenase superfamily, subfamily IA, variant 3 with third motif having DD or ED n=1 Tax=Cellulomonas marina TaxID=988821 RepID=A0A1I0WHQ9_9CELL|nr:HAD family phosphatase [Cellulomonas marina]SFA88315.1 haloacid dehalogenase superfamily, subfamily IA, variant 3 with third motif having DD or ED [Cellulomonas marina]